MRIVSTSTSIVFPVSSDKNLRLVWAMVENDSDYNSVKPEIINGVFQRVLAGEEIAIKQAVYTHG